MIKAGTLLRKFDIEKIMQSEWFQNLPDSRGDETCTCGLCDGYGTIVEGNSARMCPVFLGLQSGEPVHPAYLSLHENLRGWEGWPAPAFESFKRQTGFVKTAVFEEMETLGHACEVCDPQARILCGANGRGKTLSALMFLSAYAKRGNPCFVLRFADLIDAFKQGIEGRDRLDRYWAGIRKAKAVLIDELGRQALTGSPDHTRLALDVLVNLCYRQRFLIITTNLTAKEMVADAAFTANIQSRLKSSTGYCRVIEESGKDLRGTVRV